MPYNHLWTQLVGFVEDLFSQKLLPDLDPTQKKLTLAQLKSLEPTASTFVFGKDLTVAGARLSEETLADFDAAAVKIILMSGGYVCPVCPKGELWNSLRASARSCPERNSIRAGRTAR